MVVSEWTVTAELGPCCAVVNFSQIQFPSSEGSLLICFASCSYFISKFWFCSFVMAVASMRADSLMRPDVQGMVDAGQLTKLEKESVLEQLDGKLSEAITARDAAAAAEGQESKKVTWESGKDFFSHSFCEYCCQLPIILLTPNAHK